MIFAAPGGNGATLCLILAALYLHTKNRPIRQIEAQAAPFACMNINELLIYGLPVAWNPMLLLPFLLAPLLGASIGLMTGTAGYFDQTLQLHSWMTPVLLQPYFVSSDWIVLTLALSLSITRGTLLYIYAFGKTPRLATALHLILKPHNVPLCGQLTLATRYKTLWISSRHKPWFRETCVMM